MANTETIFAVSDINNALVLFVRAQTEAEARRALTASESDCKITEDWHLCDFQSDKEPPFGFITVDKFVGYYEVRNAPVGI